LLVLLIFAKLTQRRLKHGMFRSVDDLKTAITRLIEQHNTSEAKPFTWRADPDKIIAARNRGFQVLDSIHQGRSFAASGWFPTARISAK
jgi:hypothetical protein